MASNLPGLENILDNLDVGIIIFDNKGHTCLSIRRSCNTQGEPVRTT